MSCLDRLSKTDKEIILTSSVPEINGIQPSWFEDELNNSKHTLEYKCEEIHINITELFIKKMNEKNLTFAKLAKKIKIPVRNLKKIFEDSTVITLYDIVNISNSLGLEVKIEIK